MSPNRLQLTTAWMPILIAAASIFLYFDVLVKLGIDWWADENYSHGLLVPLVVAFIVWRDRAILREARQGPELFWGYLLTLVAIGILLLGTFGAELFIQRASLLLYVCALIVYFFGRRLLLNLAVPLTLLLLSIPIPQLLLTNITIPLQLWASQIAELGVRILGIPTTRSGNIIELVPIGSVQVVALEVVEACSGIRSMMTLAALALLLAYFSKGKTKRLKNSLSEVFRDPFTWHAVLLVASAVSIALFTNASRVAATTVATYYIGPGAADGALHDISGIVVFVTAFLLMVLVNTALLRFLPGRAATVATPAPAGFNPEGQKSISQQMVLALFITVVAAGALLNWLQHREGELIERSELANYPIYLNGAVKVGDDLRFSAPTERVLGASDYIMRDYRTAAGNSVNLYIGYYDSQRTGKTYHSPLNCLPGSGWEISDRSPVQISTGSGTAFTANKYVVQRGNYRGVMIYWFQGRGRFNASEYWDKAGTIADSILRNRTDGAIVRVMTAVKGVEAEAVKEAVSVASVAAERMDKFVPR